MILELKVPIFVQTPLGNGRALILFDYSHDINPVFMVHLNDGRFLCFNMIQLKGMDNMTFGIPKPSKPV